MNKSPLLFPQHIEPSPMMQGLQRGMVDICKPFACKFSVWIGEESPGGLKVYLRNDTIQVEASFIYTRDELTHMHSSQLAYPLLRRYKKAHAKAYIQPESNIELGEN